MGYLDSLNNHKSFSTSDVSELSSSRIQLGFSLSWRFSAQLGSAREIFEPACLAKIGLIRAKVDHLASSSYSARFLNMASLARLSSVNVQLDSARENPARIQHYFLHKISY